MKKMFDRWAVRGFSFGMAVMSTNVLVPGSTHGATCRLDRDGRIVGHRHHRGLERHCHGSRS
jgi:hypothetical protein